MESDIGVIVFPQLLDEIGLGGSLLVLAGGLLYTAGALVYAFRRPDPYPAVFGFHEVFHLLVIRSRLPVLSGRPPRASRALTSH